VIADRTAYDVRYTKTIKPVSVTRLRTAGTLRTIQIGQRVEFMNAPKLYLLKRDH